MPKEEHVTPRPSAGRFRRGQAMTGRGGMKGTLFVAALATVLLFWLTDIPLGVPGESTWERIELDQATAVDAVLGWLAALVPAAVYLAVAAFGARAVEAAAPKRMVLWLGGLV